MRNLLDDLAKIIDSFSPAEGLNQSPVTSVHCVKYSKTDRRTKRRWRACLAIVAQGSKEVMLGRQVYRLDDAHYTATPIQLPVISRVASATPEQPFLALLIDIDPLTLSEIAAQLGKDSLNGTGSPVRALFSGKASTEMLEAVIRLARLFRTPEDAQVLGPLVVKEILYYLLKGPEGLAIRQFVRSGSKMHSISETIYKLNSELSEEIDVAALAQAAHMSRSAFFKHFKEVTAMSPIHYQKRLRLLEAKRLMVDEGETAEGSAFRVGYKSASQFSREYSRMFGHPPIKHAAKLKKFGAPFNLIPSPTSVRDQK
ncbi:MAG: AraC family transcriptional regulator [Pyrinomonadaceae bacterium]